MFPSVDLSKKKWADTFNSAVKAHWENIFFFSILRTFSPLSLKGLITYHPNKLCGEKKKKTEKLNGRQLFPSDMQTLSFKFLLLR